MTLLGKPAQVGWVSSSLSADELNGWAGLIVEIFTLACYGPKLDANNFQSLSGLRDLKRDAEFFSHCVYHMVPGETWLYVGPAASLAWPHLGHGGCYFQHQILCVLLNILQTRGLMVQLIIILMVILNLLNIFNKFDSKTY